MFTVYLVYLAEVNIHICIHVLYVVVIIIILIIYFVLYRCAVLSCISTFFGMLQPNLYALCALQTLGEPSLAQLSPSICNDTVDMFYTRNLQVFCYRCNKGRHFDIYSYPFSTTDTAKLLGYDLSFLIKYLLVIQGIESNPGPAYSIMKSVQGDFNQADTRFGTSAGSQCAINSLVAICFSSVKKISTWNNVHLNFVLENGDSVYKDKGYTGYLTFQQLPEKLDLRGIEFSVMQILQGENETTQELQLVDSILSRYFWENTFLENLYRSDGAILVMDGFMFMIKKENKFFYLFDSHSRDSQGLPCANGSSIVLKFKDVFEIKKYLKHIYLTASQKTKLWFQLQFFKCTCMNKNELVQTFGSYQNKCRVSKFYKCKNKLEK